MSRSASIVRALLADVVRPDRRAAVRTALPVALIVLAVDQITKAIVLAAVPDRGLELIPGVLRLRVTTNSGAAFGLFQGGGSVIALGALLAVGLIIMILGAADHRYEAMALGAIMGGALGNLADRVFRGAGLLDGRVVDWIDFSFFWTFNVADAAITIGAVLLVLGALRRP